MEISFYDISINFGNLTMSINESYSSKKILTIINNLIQINGKYAEIKSSNQNSLKKKIPLFSLIYCKEGLYTDFTFQQYKYKNITDTTHIYYISNQCVSYDPSKIFINLNSIFIEINIWDEVFDYPELDINIDIKKINNIPRTVYIDSIDYEWMNTLFYKDHFDKFYIFDNIKKELNNSENYCSEQNESEIGNGYLIHFDKCPLLQRKKNNDIQKYKINDLVQFITKGKDVYNLIVIPNYLQYDLCRWIKEETTIEKNIEKTIFFKFMKFFLETLGNDFKKIYSFHDEIKINYKSIDIISNYKKNGIFTAFISLTNNKIIDKNNELSHNEISQLNTGDLFIIGSRDIQFENDCIAINIDFVL